MNSPNRRTTRQRTAVASAMTEVGDFRSAQQIYELLRSRGQAVGLTTVYRTLQAMAADGDVDVITGEDGEARYRACSDGHHHHLVCRTCGTTVEVAGPTVERWAARVAGEHGFTEPNHTIEISGICPACQAC
ncbi:MAG: Fur family transcriptional regulator [Candidatus Nanopelagicales bacterium]